EPSTRAFARRSGIRQTAHRERGCSRLEVEGSSEDSALLRGGGVPRGTADDPHIGEVTPPDFATEAGLAVLTAEAADKCAADRLSVQRGCSPAVDHRQRQPV